MTLVVSATNDSDMPVGLAVQTPYGAKTVASIDPGKRSAHAFTTRRATVEAGTVAVVATAVVEGETVTREYAVAYDGVTC